jgi:hypothetical protein
MNSRKTEKPLNINKYLYSKYSNYEESYVSNNINILIFSKQTHLFACYRDNLIWNNTTEYLKRLYNTNECHDRVPRITDYYKNYLKFFCMPIFKSLKLNHIIQVYGERKAEIYFKNKYNKSQSELNESTEKDNDRYSTVFNTTIKNNIEQCNIITQSLQELTKRDDSILKILSSLDCNSYRLKKKNNIKIIKRPDVTPGTTASSNNSKMTDLTKKLQTFKQKNSIDKSVMQRNSLYSIYQGNKIFNKPTLNTKLVKNSSMGDIHTQKTFVVKEEKKFKSI